jgi:hypothetical protein
MKQVDKFKKAAREFEVDDDQKRFNQKPEKINSEETCS